MLSVKSTAATTTIVDIFVVPDPPWTREPIHSARSGAPVQMLIVASVIATTRPTRSKRSFAADIGDTARSISVSVSGYTPGCEAAHPSRAARTHQGRVVRR